MPTFDGPALARWDRCPRETTRRQERGTMTLTLTGLLVLLLIAGICGAIGRSIGGGTGGGFLVSIAVGFVGALLGTVIAHWLHLPELLVVTVDHRPFPILW